MSSTVAPNGDFPDRGPAVFAVTTATLVLATVFVAARMVCRQFIVRKISWDDWTMILAWVIAFGLSFTINYGANKGLGRHDVDINPDDRDELRRSQYVFSILYNPALMATKTSILIFYLRLSKNTQKVLRFASWLTLGVVNIAGLVLTLMNIFQCRPIEAAWSTGQENTQCIPLLTEFICAAPVNIVTDLAILALPIPVLTGMRLPPRQKAILVFTFTLGIFVTVVDVVRIYYLQQAVTAVPTGVSTDPNSHFGGQPDFAWNASLSFMWSAVEVNVGMACACIPTLKPLIIKILPAMLIDPDGTRFSSRSQDKDFATSPVAARHAAFGGGDETVRTPSSNAPPDHALLGGAGDGALQEPAPAHPSTGPDAPLSAMEFLTTPDMRTGSDGDVHPASPQQHNLSGMHTARTMDTQATRSTLGANTVYFGFVNMRRPKSMLKCNASESFQYCTAVTVLFLLWGISYGLLNTLNNVIASVAGMTPAQTLGLTSAYFGGGYFFGPLLVGEWILRRDEHHRVRKKRDSSNGNGAVDSVGGFKVTFIVGLCFYGIGTIVFWPSAVTKSWGGFMLSSFLVGFGLSILETGANAFLILCGPSEYGETRLLWAQGIQGVGSVISGLLAQKVFFTSVPADDNTPGSPDSAALLNVQWTYLAITLVCVGLGLFFYYMPLPEVSDGELEEAAEKLPVDPQKRVLGGWLQLRTWSLVLAVIAQWTYVACQESNSIFFRSLLVSALPGQPRSGPGASDTASSSGARDDGGDHPAGLTLAVSEYLLIAHTAFAASRFFVGYLTYLSVRHPRIPKPRTMLSISVGLSVLFALLTVVLHPANPNLLVIPVVLFYLSEGPCWPLIFAIGLRGQGRRTKRAAAFITMGGSGPAFFPFVLYAIVSAGGTVQTAFIVIIALQVVTGAYPLFLETVRDARTMVDPLSSVSPGSGEAGDDESGVDVGREVERRRRDKHREDRRRRRTGSSAFSDFMAKEKQKILGRLGRDGERTRTMSATSRPVVEHAEEPKDGKSPGIGLGVS